MFQSRIFLRAWTTSRTKMELRANVNAESGQFGPPAEQERHRRRGRINRTPNRHVGEIFAGGGTTELVRGEPDGVPQPMIWDGRSEIVGSIVEHDGQLYELAPTEASSQRRAEQRHHLCLRL
jgi:hypothetical protein